MPYKYYTSDYVFLWTRQKDRCLAPFLVLQCQITNSLLSLFPILSFFPTLFSSQRVPMITCWSVPEHHRLQNLGSHEVSGLIKKTLRGLPADLCLPMCDCPAAARSSVTHAELFLCNSQEKPFLSLLGVTDGSTSVSLHIHEAFDSRGVLSSSYREMNQLFNSENICRKCHSAM